MAPQSTTGSSSGAKTNAELTAGLIEMQRAFTMMEQQLQQKNEEIASLKTGRHLKVPLPDKYDGSKGKLQAFLTSANMYIRYNKGLFPTEADKVLVIANQLSGTAFDWMEPRIRDWLDNHYDEQQPETRYMFKDFEHFVQKLQQIYGNMDEELEAERRIYELRQKGSAKDYTVQFQQQAARLSTWNDGALASQYYRGLKDHVKDEIARDVRPSTLASMINTAVQIDDRAYERKLEKRGYESIVPKTGNNKQPANHKAPRKPQQGYGHQNKQQHSYGDPMDIDTARVPRRYTKEQEEWKRQGLCLECGKSGHYARDCYKKKGRQVNVARRPEAGKPDNPPVKQRIPLPTQREAYQEARQEQGRSTTPSWQVAINMTKKNYGQNQELKHAKLNWTECQEEVCPYHWEEKEANGRKIKAEEIPAITTEYASHMGFPVGINGKEIRVMIDSGAHGNFIDPDCVYKQGFGTLEKTTPYPVIGLDGAPIGNFIVKLETVPLTMGIQQHVERISFDVVPMQGQDVILGIPWLTKHNPQIDWTKRSIKFKKECRETCQRPMTTPENKPQSVERDASGRAPGNNSVAQETEEQVSLVRALATSTPSVPEEYQEFLDVFEKPTDLESLPDHQEWDHAIELVEGATPNWRPIYQLSEKELQATKEYINNGLAKGWIRESKSPVRYPLMFVPKKDGNLRPCIDYRDLNRDTKKNRYPLPLISEIRDRLQGATIFTKMDIRDAYYQVRIREGDEWKTAFGTRYGHYEYLVMPFGLCNAPATFQALVNNTLREYLDIFVTVYLDDVLIYSKDEEEHKKHVKLVLEALRSRNLRAKLEKCEFHTTDFDFLGYHIRPGQIGMESGKVRAILEWPAPTNLKETQALLGMGNYYRRFITGYSTIIGALTKLTKKDQPFVWGEDQKKAFQALKIAFAQQPVLKMYDREKPIVVETDASDYAIGACLSQPDDQGRLHPVAYYSRKMIPAEQNYDIHDKELLAIVKALKEWRVYLEGSKHPFTVITDHKNLEKFTTTKELTRRQVRWAQTLASYDFKITYRKGSENGRADALSRRSDYKDDGPRPGYQLLRVTENGDLEYANPQVAVALIITNEGLRDKLIAAYENDTMAKELEKRVNNDPHVDKDSQGLLRFYDKLYVPTKLRQEVIRNNHDSPTSGHQGADKTLERIKMVYYFPTMRQMVKEYVSKCNECARNKSARHAPYGSMQISEKPNRPWETIALDWIVKLPKSKEPMTGTKYDSILVITDQLTKYGLFVPYMESSTAEELAYIFLREVVSNHGMPTGIISDRDKWLTSKFWTSLVGQLGIKQKMSTAYHPQTDGQTERLNQTLEQYLRCYVNYRQNNWVELLPIAQYAYNSAVTESTKMSPYMANYGFEPQVFYEPMPAKQMNQTAKFRITQMKEIQRQLTQDLRFVGIRAAKYYDSNRSAAPTLKEGDKVYLLRKNIKTKRPSAKLDHVKIGPYIIKKKIGRLSYELDLPEGTKIHPVFHVSLLEPAHEDTPLDTRTRIVNEEEEEYEVEDFMDYQEIDGEKHYLVKWKDYPHSENTWEPIHHLQDYGEEREDFHRRNRQFSRMTNSDLVSRDHPNQPTDHSAKEQRPQNQTASAPGLGPPVQISLATRYNANDLLQVPFHHEEQPQTLGAPALQWTPTPEQTSPSPETLINSAEHEPEFSWPELSAGPEGRSARPLLPSPVELEGHLDEAEPYQLDDTRQWEDQEWRKYFRTQYEATANTLKDFNEQAATWARFDIIDQLKDWHPHMTESDVFRTQGALRNLKNPTLDVFLTLSAEEYALYNENKMEWKKEHPHSHEDELRQGMIRAAANVHSALDTTKSHFILVEEAMHSEHFPLSSTTRHSLGGREVRQRVQGVGMMREETRGPESSSRRRPEDETATFTALGMTGHDGQRDERGGTHLLYPHETEQLSFRDESWEGGSECYRHPSQYERRKREHLESLIGSEGSMEIDEDADCRNGTALDDGHLSEWT
jgi:hypothetical protein